jgi:hypothetical protein
MSTKPEVRVERLLGRTVLAANNHPVGLLEEFRAEKHGHEWIVTGYFIGPAGWLERMDLRARLLVAPKQRGYFARADQMDVSDESHPRLTVPVSELERLE